MSSSPDHKSLAGASLSALQWDYLGSATRLISSTAVTVVLARLLGPEPFGLVAIAWVVIGMGNLIADFGIGPALVQRPVISEQDIRYAFTCQMGLGLALAIVLGLPSPLLGSIFNEPMLIPVLAGLAPMFVLQAFGVTALSILRRRLEFKKIQIAQISSYLCGYLCAGIPLAVFGYGVWSLIIAQLLQVALFSMACYLQVRHPIKPRFIWSANGLIEYGGKVLLSNVVNYSISSLPTLFIGRVFDVVFVGLYNRAQSLVSMPMQSAVATLQRVAFSTYSRRQDDWEAVRKAYLALVGFMWLIVAPAYGSVALVPTTIIQGLFGAGWEAAVPLLVPLALAMPFHALMALGGPMLWSRNRVGTELGAQLVTAIVFCLVLFVSSAVSLFAMVWGIFVISVLRFILITHVSLKTLSAGWLSLFNAVRGGSCLLMITAPIVLLSNQWMEAWYVSAPVRLVLDLFIGVSTATFVAVMLPRQFLSAEMRWLWDRIATEVPMPAKLVMRRLIPLTTGPRPD